ncbi:glycosyltransferase family 39 protein, partial [Candidatus Collierbacteria bacterium]|nr:glycosyltransferase family 39 protein [Candidatus Collierbacteria bacterium]
MKIIEKLEIPILCLVLVLAFLLRLYKIDNPIADWHSWRQADTASVTKIFSEKGVNFFLPRYQDLSNIPSGKENPQGYRMVEAPIYNLIHLMVFRLAPGLGIDKAGRLTSVILSLISLVFLYLIVRKLSGKMIGLLTAFFFAVLPFSIYYSRVVLPEPLMITFFLVSFFLFIQNKKLGFILSAVFLALALLVKPYAIFFTLPYLFFYFSHHRTSRGALVLLLFFAAAAAPLLLWRLWIRQ